MTIPGTHETMARRGFGAVCQNRSITDQYKMGVRFVDIRCRWYGNDLPIHHGIYYQNAAFDWGVVKPTVQFLRDNPTETVLMLVKHELFKTRKGNLSFSTLVENCFDKYSASVLYNVPETLGEARGHIILFNKDWPDEDRHLGTDLFSYFEVEDDWKQHNRRKRWVSAKEHLDKAIVSDSPFLTYVSGFKTDPIIHKIPNTYAMADYLNKRLGPYVSSHVDRKSRLGVVLVDMAPDEIVGDLIHCN